MILYAASAPVRLAVRTLLMTLIGSRDGYGFRDWE